MGNFSIMILMNGMAWTKVAGESKLFEMHASNIPACHSAPLYSALSVQRQ